MAETFGELLDRAGLNQRDAAVLVELSAMSISRYALGRAVPSLETAEELAAAIGEALGEATLDATDVLLACCYSILRDRDRGVVETRPLDNGSASDVVTAASALWGVAGAVDVSDEFRAQVKELGEALLAAVADELRRGAPA